MRPLAIALLLLVLCIPTLVTHASSMCDQTFSIYGKTNGQHGLFIYDEFVGGQCYFWTVFYVHLGNDRTIVLEKRIDGGGQGWVPQLLASLPVEPPRELTSRDGIFQIEDGVTFTAPAADTTFLRKWNRLSANSYADAATWRKKCPADCSDDLAFSGTDAERVYTHERGLYKSYSIKRALYYPDSQYLVVITKQPMLVTGGDTMDGLLIYRLTTGEGE